MEQVDRGIDILVTNPELVKTGLDLLNFPTIDFLQPGYRVYRLQQASRRSWWIGQTEFRSRSCSSGTQARPKPRV